MRLPARPSFPLVHRHTHTFVPNILFNSAAQKYTSAAFKCLDYHHCLLLFSVDVTSNPTDIFFVVQFSDDGVTYYNYVRDPLVDFRFEDAAGDKLESIDIPILAPYMKIYCESSGCEATKTFAITIKGIFNR